MFNPVVISLKVGQPPQFINGVTDSKRRVELRTAQKLLRELGNSSFSVSSFGMYLHDATANEEERDRMLLSALYYINSVAGENDTSRSFMARRIMDTLDHFGYVNVGIEVDQTFLD